MSFVAELNRLPQEALAKRCSQTSTDEARRSLGKSKLALDDFASLLSPAACELLEPMARRSQAVTRRRFGNVMRLFAPLYLSNECVNNCKYCGFSRNNPILRVTLSVEETRREAKALQAEGFRNILLVAGEHPKFVSRRYLVDCITALHGEFPSVSLEIGPMETEDYRSLVEAGADCLVVFQETYNRAIYGEMHTSGPKRNFEWRLETPERAYAAGFRRLGIGALYGLSDWRSEAICLAAHAEYLLRHCWKAQLTISLPRLRPCAGEFQPVTHISERDIAQLVCALRLFLPDVGIVLSTRERAEFRDGLFPLGITMISAGSHTEPGGYTGAGREHLHHTERGRVVALATPAREKQAQDGGTSATGQFEIADTRSSAQVAAMLRRLGYEPVWKDWDASLSA
jgi:2-iminoacetate synthase